MIEKLNKKDIRLFAIAIAVIAVSSVIIQRYFRRAFPEAAIEFKITKEEAARQAEAFLKNRQWEVEGYRHASVFNFDTRSRTFLERHLDAEEAGRVFNEINAWRWSNRWFKPEQKEEFRVAYSTRGELAYFERFMPEEAPGDSLEQGVARDIAEFYLVGFLDWNPDAWEEVEAWTEDRPNRVDHKFTWKKKDFEIGGATHRLSLQVNGSEVVRYNEWLKVPEAWEREYTRLRSKNALAGSIAAVLYILAIIAIIIIVFLRMRLRDIRWRTAYVYGIAIGVLFALNQLNNIPLTAYWFDTKDSNLTYILQTIIFNVILASLGFGAFVALIIAGAETMYRDRYPRQIALRNLLTPDGLKTRSFMTSALVGISLTALTLAFQAVFYLTATRLGAWSPTQVPDINRLGTLIPWVAVLIGGFAPAVMEESVSRMFSIPFLQKYARSTVLAVLASALIWGFAHAGYPAQPFFVRGVEVGIMGVLVGVVFLRFGFLAVLIWHFSVDAVYSAVVLVQSGNPYYVATAIVCAGVVFIPLIYSIVSYFRNGGFLVADHLTNATDTAAAPVKAIEIEKLERAKIDADYRPLSRRRVRIGFAILAAGLVSLLIPVEEDLKGLVRYEVNREGAIEIARDYVAKFDFDLSDYRVASEPDRKLSGRGPDQELYPGDPGESAAVYLLEKGDVDAVQWAYTHHVVPSEWWVRFFRPLEKEEYNVYIDPRRGEVSGHNFLVADSTYLPSISTDSAELVVRRFLAERGHDLTQFELLKSERIEKEKRTDHAFTFKSRDDNPGSVGESYLLYYATIHGNRVGQYARGIKVPEVWLREFRKETPAGVARAVIMIVFFIGLVALWFLTLFKLMKHNRPTWRPVVLAGIAFAVVLLVGMVNNYGALFLTYDTSIPLSTHVFLNAVLQFVYQVLLGCFLLALAIVSVQIMHPEALYAVSGVQRRNYLRDALLSVPVGLGVLFVMTTAEKIVALLIPSLSLARLSAEPDVGGVLAAVGLLGNVLVQCILVFFAIVIIRYVFRRYGPEGNVKRPLSAVVILLLITFAAAGEHPPDVYYKWAWVFLKAGSFLLIWYFFWRRNPLSYILGPLATISLATIWGFWQMTGAVYRVHAWAAAGVILLLFALLMLDLRRPQALKTSPGEVQ